MAQTKEKINLELFLVTYNRKDFLQKTLQAVLGENSPVKNFPLTVLDNCSTDGTSELIDTYCQKFPNVRHIRHTKNIGGNANIARAFESARAEYVWVLCDDDTYTLENWPACEQALAQKPAAVVVANYLHPQKSVAHLFRQLSFVPAAIYRTDLITSDTLINMYFNVSNMFPQLAVAAEVLNSGENVIILDKPLVTMQLNPDASYQRGTSAQSKAHPLMRELFWTMGYLRTLPLLRNKKQRNACSQLIWAEDYTSFLRFCNIFRMQSFGHFWYNYITALHLLSGWAKWKFAFLVQLFPFAFFYRTDKEINLCLFDRAKMRIWKFSTPKKN